VLNMIAPDGSTLIAVQSETTSAYAVAVDLPPGSFEIVTVSASAQQGGLVRVPYRGAGG
jgi:hypothetical protein